MQLSKRLKMVADFVTPGRTAADIGCDHAYLAIDLIRRKLAEHVIAMDIREGPLKRAGENIDKYGCGRQIELRQSDGLEKLAPGEAQTLALAGMGGRLMKEILEAGRPAAEQASELVLQPQSHVPEVRRYLHQAGFRIQDEGMVWEAGKYYTVIRAVRGYERYEDPLFYQFGRALLENRDPCLKQYLSERKEKTERMIKQMEKNASPDSQTRIEQIKYEYFHIIKACGRWRADGSGNE